MSVEPKKLSNQEFRGGMCEIVSRIFNREVVQKHGYCYHILYDHTGFVNEHTQEIRLVLNIGGIGRNDSHLAEVTFNTKDIRGSFLGILRRMYIDQKKNNAILEFVTEEKNLLTITVSRDTNVINILKKPFESIQKRRLPWVDYFK